MARSIRSIAGGALLAAAVTCCLPAAAARAALLAFEFATLVDATDFGLSADEPLVIRYEYDPFTVPLVIALGTPVVVRHIYGPVLGTFTIGGDVVAIEGQLSIDDENSGHDSYDFYAGNFIANTSVSGSVNGTSIYAFDLYLLDQSAPTAMLASLAPPGSTAFASEATLVRVDFRDFSNQKVVLRDFAPLEHGLFTFTAPEPDALANGLAAAGALAFAARCARPR